MLRPLFALLLLFLALPAHAALDVCATVPSLAAIAKAIGGEDAKVRALALHTQDPHFVDAKPNLALELSRADLILVIGLDLEIGWLPRLITGSRNPKIQKGGSGYLDVSGAVKLLDSATAPVDRSQGDIHPGGNPHYLYDPRAAAAVARAVADRMIALDPQHADGFRQRLKLFLDTVEGRRADWELRLAALRGVSVVTYHQSFSYLADWLGFLPVAMLEPKPGIPPNPAHIARVLVTAKKEKVKVVLQEQYYPDRSSLVAERIPAPLVVLPGGTNFAGGQSYVEHLDEIGKRLEAALPKTPTAPAMGPIDAGTGQ